MSRPVSRSISGYSIRTPDVQRKEGLNWDAPMASSDTSNFDRIGTSNGYWADDTYASSVDRFEIPVSHLEPMIGGNDYVPYPPSKPFIHDDYSRDPCRAVTAYPESNRQAVMSALKNLQDKIRQLELDRATAANARQTELDRVTGVANARQTGLDRATGIANARQTGLDQVKGVSNARQTGSERATNVASARQSEPVHSQHAVDRSNTSTMQTRNESDRTASASDDRTVRSGLYNKARAYDKRDTSDKLDAAQKRCELLDRQLEYMRELVRRAEEDRNRVLARSAQLLRGHDGAGDAGDALTAQRDKYSPEGEDLREKMQELEREQLHLTATRTLAENKIRELQEALAEERRYRELVERNQGIKVAPLDEPERDETVGTKKVRRKRRGLSSGSGKGGGVKRNVVSRPCRSTANQKQATTEPPELYRMNLAEMPFINGKSVGPSHSLNANFQQVMSLIKLGSNPRLYSRSTGSGTADRTEPGTTTTTDRYGNSENDATVASATVGAETRKKVAEEADAVSKEELEGMLVQLEEELATLSFEREELMRQIDTLARGSEPACADLEKDLSSLVHRINTKGDQISLLRRYQQMMSRKPHGTVRARSASRRANSAKPLQSASQPSSASNSRADIRVTTTVQTRSRSARQNSAGRQGNSLKLYKELQRMQSTLRSDDVSWD